MNKELRNALGRILDVQFKLCSEMQKLVSRDLPAGVGATIPTVEELSKEIAALKLLVMGRGPIGNLPGRR